MPHQCVKCNTFYEDGSNQLLKGCTNCGGKFFFFVRKEHLDEAKNLVVNITKKEKQQIEKDIYNIAEIDADRTRPVVLDLESIRVLKPGQYELDLVKLLQKYPLVYRLEEGKYIIDLTSTFKLEDLNKIKK
mgnify:CR=1 FL=1